AGTHRLGPALVSMYPRDPEVSEDRHDEVSGRGSLLGQGKKDSAGLVEIAQHIQRDAQPQPAEPRREPVAERVGEVEALLSGGWPADRLTPNRGRGCLIEADLAQGAPIVAR